ncbi:hypothetical protein BpHYR1_050456 [Brachionus plicatilis]|uniref:Uncharacterized protein n=1 Tax=Brachionus plicatilis TaxID=10195 RepID=A0A3M7QBM9_BRAPC|nr:hypothetical protein BpHYR1_050456 [Brachionus plicatilis]
MEDEDIPQVHHDNEFPMLESQDNWQKRGANHLTYSPSGVQQKTKQKHHSELAAVLIRRLDIKILGNSLNLNKYLRENLAKLGIRPDDIRVKPTANGNLIIYPEKEEHKTVMLSDEKVFEGYEKIDTGVAKQYSVIVRNIAGSEIEQEDKEKYGMVKVIPFERNGREIKVCKIILDDVSVFEEIDTSVSMGLGYTKYPVKESSNSQDAPSGFYRNESAMYSNAVYVAKPSSNNDSCMREMGQNLVKLLEMKNTVESIEKRLYKYEEKSDQKIEDSIIVCREWGFGLNRNSLQLVVKNYAKILNKSSFFKNGIPAKVNKSKPTRFESRSSSATKTKIHRTITKTANSSCRGAAKAKDSSTKIAVNQIQTTGTKSKHPSQTKTVINKSMNTTAESRHHNAAKYVKKSPITATDGKLSSTTKAEVDKNMTGEKKRTSLYNITTVDHPSLPQMN